MKFFSFSGNFTGIVVTHIFIFHVQQQPHNHNFNNDDNENYTALMIDVDCI